MARDSFKVQNAVTIDGVTVTLSGATAGQSLWRDGTSVSPRTETPVGTVVMYAGSIGVSPGYSGLPSGWLLCDGSTFSSSTYPALASVVGNMYGTSSGTTYYLPNFVSRTVVAHTQSSGDTSSGWGGIITSTTGGANHQHSTSHNAANAALNHSHNSNSGQSHGHNVSDGKSDHTHGSTDSNLGSHTHTITTVAFPNLTTNTGTSNEQHTHNSSTNNANHAHNSSNSNSSNHGHNSSSDNFADHTHQLTVNAFAANQSANTHTHGSGISAIGIFFIIKAS